jgi:hypothetical protein
LEAGATSKLTGDWFLLPRTIVVKALDKEQSTMGKATDMVDGKFSTTERRAITLERSLEGTGVVREEGQEAVDAGINTLKS